MEGASFEAPSHILMGFIVEFMQIIDNHHNLSTQGEANSCFALIYHLLPGDVIFKLWHLEDATVTNPCLVIVEKSEGWFTREHLI